MKNMSNELNKSLVEIKTGADELQGSDTVKKNEIDEAITRFLHKARDIKWSARIFVPKASEMMKARYDKAIEQIKNGELLLARNQDDDRAHAIKDMQGAMRKLERIKYSQTHIIVETSLFLSLFSAFDEYTGDLLSAIYQRKPQLFDKLNRKIDLVDVLTASSIDDLKRSVLNDLIECFRRKSYIEQFSELENTFGLTLRNFPRWQEFVECSQRRNLLTHCGGVVSEQYRKICRDEGYPESKIPPLGTVLKLGPKYFLPTCELMIEVALMLGQTLWRKILPDEIGEADAHLNHAQYDALYSQNWERAKVFGEFAINQKKFSDEIHKRISIINYCIALKFSGDEERALKELNKIDWTASINDFRLAEAVLNDRFEDAATIMIRIGKSGEILNEGYYHTWPIFTKFRGSSEFMTAYEKIYGYPFVTELKRYVDKAATDISAIEAIEAQLIVERSNNQSESAN